MPGVVHGVGSGESCIRLNRATLIDVQTAAGNERNAIREYQSKSPESLPIYIHPGQLENEPFGQPGGIECEYCGILLLNHA